MSAYYNEIDPFAADWLRELIKAGHIAPGEVDTRSIEDVDPTDLAGFAQCHFFAGIAVWSYALRLAGWPDDRPVWTGSCPCQPFSQAGKGKGVADERHLWPAFFHLISQCRPFTIFGEQVASKGGLAWFDLVQADLEGAGYSCGAVDTCSAGFGAPHIRQRLYWVADALPTGWPEGRAGSGSGQIAGNGCVGGLAHATSLRRLQQRGAEEAEIQGECAERSGQHQKPQYTGQLPGGFEGLCGACGMVNAPDFHRKEQSEVRGLGGPESSLNQKTREGNGKTNRTASGARRLAYTSSQQEYKKQQRSTCAERRWNSNEPRGCGVADAIPSTCPTNGYWQNADWLLCRDGKWRPVEPGTFPLAYGSANRVGRLRGYGNAINAIQAKEFIRCFMEYRESVEGWPAFSSLPLLAPDRPDREDGQ